MFDWITGDYSLSKMMHKKSYHTLIQDDKTWPEIYMSEYSRIAKKIVRRNNSKEGLAY